MRSWNFRNLNSITQEGLDDKTVKADLASVLHEASVIKVYDNDGALKFVYSRKQEE